MNFQSTASPQSRSRLRCHLDLDLDLVCYLYQGIRTRHRKRCSLRACCHEATLIRQVPLNHPSSLVSSTRRAAESKEDTQRMASRMGRLNVRMSAVELVYVEADPPVACHTSRGVPLESSPAFWRHVYHCCQREGVTSDKCCLVGSRAVT